MLRVLLLTGAIWRIRLIRVPPKSLRLLRRIIINRVIKISWICTLIVRSSLLTLPSWRALSIHALPLNCHDRIIHLDMVTVLVERRVQVLPNCFRCGSDLIKDFGPPPSSRSSLGACPSLPTLRRLILPSA